MSFNNVLKALAQKHDSCIICETFFLKCFSWMIKRYWNVTCFRTFRKHSM